ncbi:MAG TPA: helix-turn-helix domain-containing protein [Candidatus Limnocylindrales bacterium]|nr:helix-turn-helix domain-containing protein [Candidatus Limnocylindrales bacterium]
MTRAVEILGERWTLLLVRELFYGPKRFSDLKATLGGVSSSVLAERLSRLEERGVIVRRELPAPAASMVYELAETGWALRPILIELARWGVRFMGPPSPDDRMEPAWLRFGLEVFARRTPTASLAVQLRITGEGHSVDVFVRGGEAGVLVTSEPLRTQATITAPAMDMLFVCIGLRRLDAPDLSPQIRVEGDATAAAHLPELFDFSPTPPTIPVAGAGPTLDASSGSGEARAR